MPDDKNSAGKLVVGGLVGMLFGFLLWGIGIVEHSASSLQQQLETPISKTTDEQLHLIEVMYSYALGKRYDTVHCPYESLQVCTGTLNKLAERYMTLENQMAMIRTGVEKLPPRDPMDIDMVQMDIETLCRSHGCE